MPGTLGQFSLDIYEAEQVVPFVRLIPQSQFFHIQHARFPQKSSVVPALYHKRGQIPVFFVFTTTEDTEITREF